MRLPCLKLANSNLLSKNHQKRNNRKEKKTHQKGKIINEIFCFNIINQQQRPMQLNTWNNQCSAG